MIRIENLTYIFPPDQIVLKNLSCTLPENKMIGIVGADGAGKTTLLRLIAGLLKPTKGKIEILRHDTIEDIDQIRAFSSYMPQRFGLYEDLTVLQNLELYAALHGVQAEARSEIFEKLLKFAALTPFTKRLAFDLSGGMKQKLGLACALLQKPKLLILDEPSVGVDPISRRELWKMIRSLLSEGISILWSTTYLNEAKNCDILLLLNEGKILYQGPPMNLEDAFSENRLNWSEAAPFVKSRNEEVVVVKDLVKKFGSFTAVNGLSFSIRKGEIFGLLGPNGSGKSTTFKMLCGLLKPTSGSLKTAPRSQIGYMAQKFSLYGNLTVKQNLEFFAGIYSTAGTVQERLKLFHLEKEKNQDASTIPLGLKQRLALAVATIHWPSVLFLDEPTSGMDPASRKQFWSEMKELCKKGVAILISTHFMDEAENCDRIGLMYDGLMIHLDTPGKLKEMAKTEENQNPSLEDAFIQLIEKHA